MKTTILVVVVAMVVVAFASTACFVNAPAPTPGSLQSNPVNLAERRNPSNHDGSPSAVTAKPTRSTQVQHPKPQSLHFKGAYELGEVCLPYRGDPRSLAMYELTSVSVIGLIRGNEALQERIAKHPLTFTCIGRPKRYSRLSKGTTYTVRLVPSDETWNQIERGDGVVSLDCQEMEVLPDGD